MSTKDYTPTENEQRLSELATTVAEGESHLASDAMPQAVREDYGTFRSSVERVVAAGRQVREDLNEIEEKKALLPVAGYNQLRERARAAAQQEASSAGVSMTVAYASLEAALVEAALPSVDAKRESLAREEVRDAFSSGASEGDVHEFVQNGSDEAVAALLSPWGRNYLQRNLGLDADKILDRSRRVVALLAAEKSSDADRIIASSALRSLPRLGAARGAAEAFLRHSV